ncbi:hypothetical protein NM688_g8114 [Phlebia brevispora]|uniref:Uncharacterized protein n=1 Tax=Phlebia brevispora TaxID=194682 RepID=A0ACC1RX61_9APHY|nr:hypothetical protein NM688_g8114 [Phlebia brevispora]
MKAYSPYPPDLRHRIFSNHHFIFTCHAYHNLASPLPPLVKSLNMTASSPTLADTHNDLQGAPANDNPSRVVLPRTNVDYEGTVAFKRKCSTARFQILPETNEINLPACAVLVAKGAYVGLCRSTGSKLAEGGELHTVQRVYRRWAGWNSKAPAGAQRREPSTSRVGLDKARFPRNLTPSRHEQISNVVADGIGSSQFATQLYPDTQIHFPSGIMRSRFSPERAATPQENCMRTIYGVDVGLNAVGVADTGANAEGGDVGEGSVDDVDVDVGIGAGDGVDNNIPGYAHADLGLKDQTLATPSTVKRIPRIKGPLNLTKLLDISRQELAIIKKDVHRLAQEKLDCSRTLIKQDKIGLSELCEEAAQDHPILDRFEAHWVTKEMLKSFVGRRNSPRKVKMETT